MFGCPRVLQCYNPHKIRGFLMFRVLQRCYKGATGCYSERVSSLKSQVGDQPTVHGPGPAWAGKPALPYAKRRVQSGGAERPSPPPPPAQRVGEGNLGGPIRLERRTAGSGNIRASRGAGVVSRGAPRLLSKILLWIDCLTVLS